MFGHVPHHGSTSQGQAQAQSQAQSHWTPSHEAHLQQQQQGFLPQQEPPHHAQQHQAYQYTLAHAPNYDYPVNPENLESFNSRPASSSASTYPHHHHHPSYAPRQISGVSDKPPTSSGSTGSESVSSGESAATTGPGNISSSSTINQQQSLHASQYSQHQQLPQTPSSAPAPASQTSSSSSSANPQNEAHVQASPLFDVPPGYRTMLSSDKHAAAAATAEASRQLQHQQAQQQHTAASLVSEGGSAPVRHHSMPSSMSMSLSTTSLPSSSPSIVTQQYPPSIQPVQQQQDLQHIPSSSSSSSSYIHTPIPYFTASPVPIAQHQPQQPHYQQQQQQEHQPLQYQSNQSYQQNISPPSAQSGSGSIPLPASTPVSESSDSGSGRSSRYPRRHQNQPEGMELTTASQPQAQAQGHNDAQFVVPAPPSSAPASTTSFAVSGGGSGSGPSSSNSHGHSQISGRHVRGQSGVFKLEPPDESYMKYARTSTSGSSAGLSTNPSSAMHSRSPSVSSTSYSSFGPLSASTSSSASSSFGELSSSTSTPRRAMRLSNLDRRALCQYADSNPRVKHEHIGTMFGVERSTVSKILKQKSKWLSVTDDNIIPISPTSERKTKEGKLYKNRIGRHPEMEAMLIEWGKEQTRSGTVLTDDNVRTKALEFAETLNIEIGSFKASAGWLDNFKERAKYKNGKFDLDAPLPSQFASSSRDPSEEIMDADADSSETTSTGAEEQSSRVISQQQSGGTAGSSSDNLAGSLYSPQAAMGRVSSPLRHRRQKRGGLSSLSSSTLSLPGLMEQHEEQRSAEMDNSSSSAELRSRGSSFSNLNMQPLTYGSRHQQQSSASYSADSSPFPSPTCSTGSELGQSMSLPVISGSAGPLLQTSTPTQRTVYNVSYTPHSGDHHYRNAYGAGPPSTRLQQAGINFNLSLNSSPSLQPQQPHHLPTIEAGQPLDLMHLHTPIDHNVPAYSNYAYPQNNTMSPLQQQGAFDQNQGSTIDALRTRVHSVPGTTLHQQFAPYGHSPNDSRLHDQATLYHMNDHSPSQSSQYMMSQHKVPLHRSQTDPMPLYPGLEQQAEQSGQVQHQGDSTVTPADNTEIGGDHSSMQIDSSHRQGDESLIPFQQQYAPPQAHPHVQASHARRATVSSGGDLSFSSTSGSASGSSYGHGHSYSMSAVTTPIFGSFAAAAASSTSSGGNSKVSLAEAYLSLRKVVNYLHDNNQPNPLHANIAAPLQIETLEALLAQFKEAHLSQIPTLTPPSST